MRACPLILRNSEEDMRSPDWCWTCGRKCGSKPH